MKNIKISKIGIVVSLAFSILSLNTSAKTENYSVGFSTVPDITITQNQAMDFGSGLFLASGSACDMNVTDHSGTGYAGDVVMGLSRTADEAADPAYSILGGAATDCVDAGTATGTPGLYEIVAVPGGQVKVTVNDVTAGTAFNFVATGCVGDYDGAGDGDDCTDVSAGLVTVQVADAGDTVGNNGLGLPVPGKTFIAVGGTITSQANQTANALLTESFTIDVTY